MGAHAVSTYWMLAGTCVFLNVLISSVIGQIQIPDWDHPPQTIAIREDTPVGTIIGSLKLINGDGLMITSESNFVNVTNPQSGPHYITVDIILNTILDYDSGVTQLNCFFKGINNDIKSGNHLEVKVIVTDVNDEPPHLENQPYSISVSEDAASGSVVYTFTSKDLDPGDTPTFSLTAHAQAVDDEYKNKFVVNNATGLLMLMGKLDFESVRFYEYTVTVKDQVGHNNTAQVYITILDVQDTPPFFTGEPFQKKMDESTTANTDLLHVIATDGDRGAPNDIMFSIINDSCGGLFKIDSKSGWISLKNQTDRDTGLVSSNNGVCILGIQATEDNQHPQPLGNVSMTTTSATITVLDINDNVPTFSSTIYTVQVDENTLTGVPINIKMPIGVSDADQGNNAKFDVTITKLKEYFEVTPSQVQSVGEILIRVTNSTILDYEKYHNLTLELEARDSLGSTTATVTISINNVNDNSPIFTNSAYVGNVEENSGSGTSIITITATDADANSGTDNFNEVTYSLEPSDSSFKIDNFTGEVMVDQVQLDRETRSVYYVTVVAKDGGGSKASVVLEIRVLDQNDEYPRFVTNDYQTSLNEGNTNFIRVITVQATDNDEPNSSNSNVTYKILQTTSPSGLASHFHITTNGLLTVTSALDFESIFQQGGDGKITLTVEADDQGKPVQTSTVSVIIFLQDINNKDPLCDKPSYMISIPENSNRSSKIIQVGASDKDGTKPNNAFMFSIDQESAGKFIMDSSTGWLTLRDVLDREQKASYLINVTVNDLGIPSRSGSCQISVMVNDTNDSPPVFDQKQMAFNAFESKPGQVFPVSAHDPDLNPNLFYNISWQDCTAQDPNGQTTNPSVLQNWVTISHSNGTITITDQLDRETVESFTLAIQVTDLNTVTGSKTDETMITITVIDENDEAPIFTGGHSYTASIQENMPAGSDIRFDNRAILEISDADEGVNSKFSVKLLTFNNTFSISPTTGTSKQTFTISVIDSSALNYEKTTYFILEVLAVDDNDSSKKNSATITVNITNENDNIPQFSGSPPYTASLPENSTDGTLVYKVVATDDDSGIFGIVEYFLEDKFKTFDIDNTTGEVFLFHGDLDRENISEYTVTLIAKDKGNFRATTQLVISVADVNDKAPKFSKNLYSLTFDEETVILPAFYVQATDDDDPNSPNSKVKYSLMTANGKPYSFFSIDPTSGTLKLSSSIDCEDSYKACNGTLILQVQATDQGTPSKSDITTIEITVMDTNDNCPEFSPKSYAASVKEDALPNKLVLNVSATDKDASTTNNQVSYSLDTLSNKTFSIDAHGKITVKDKLDRETTPHYTIIVTALDNGVPVLTSTASVEIDVEDVNDTPPTFSWSSLSVTKQENTNDLIAQNIANDPDLNNELHYSIVWADSSGMDGAGRYIPGTSLQNYISINETTGEVFPVGELDREQAQRFQLTLFVKDQKGITPQNDTAILTIIVQDENDAPPTFQGGDHFTGIIQENMPKDSEVKMINISALIISDGDTGNNSMYDITLNDSSVFKISPSKGDGSTTCVISVVNPLQLDYETQQNFTLKVIAIESSTVERYNNTATVTVLIENTDDEIPQFSSPLFEVSFHENNAIGDSVTTLSATDKDLGEFGIVEYYIDGPQTWFTIDNQTGLVRVNTKLDREIKDSYTVTVKARDIKNYEGSTQLTVRVTDENDQKPVFQETSYAAEVVEHHDFFKVPLVVKATDNDEYGTSNSQIFYSITKIPPQFSPGSLYINDKTGEINFTSSAPDYEAIIAHNVQGGFFQIEVTATDGGIPSKNSSVMVNVTVKDSNDVPPEFHPNSYNGHVLENAPEGVSIVTVTASDGDGTSPNNEFYYVIQSGSHDKFQINSSTGEITVGVGAALDREGVDKDGFKLIVWAIDKGTPALTGTATVTIAVQDVNDSPPTISPINGLFYVYENDSVSTQITSFKASDPDEYPELEFDVLWVDSHAYDEKEKETNQNLTQAWLQIDPVSGVITVKSEMDREMVEQMVLKVIVADKNASSNIPQVVTATVTVSILDVNDNPPVISSTGDTLNLNISEGTKVNTEVATLTATDADKGQKITFSLENTNSSFRISESGKLQLIGKLDRETQPELNFIVVATDSGSPAMSSNITVNIIVLDINDNDPQFQGTNFTFYIRENSDNTTHVATIKADDADDGDNKNVTFEFKDISPFYINPITGEIYVSGNLDRESEPSYILTVIAADNPSLESRRRASIQIKIIIQDVNDNPPIFKQTEYTGKISEERKVGESVTISPSAISATDKDEAANANITYLLMDSDDFDIDPVTGDVTVKRSILDRSADYSYVVNATDGGSPALWTVVNLTITIIDANNHYPEFVNKEPPSIPECAQHGKFVYKFVAKDNDTDQTTNAKVQYKLFDGAGSNDSLLFRLDSDSGELFTAATGDPLVPLFNHDTHPVLRIEIMAVDNGDPQMSSGRVPLTIKVTDINNNAPEFDQKNVTFHVKEEQEGISVGAVKAFDKDENTHLAYEISDGDLGWKDYFYIDTDPDPDKGGIIYINKSLDREMLDKFVIKVIAVDLTQQVQDGLCNTMQPTDIQRSQPQEVVLMVDDINDNPPVFTKKSLAIGFLSSTEFGKILTFLQNFVQDKDTLPNSVHKFYQLGEAIPDKELSKTWSTTIMPDPIKVDLNGTLSTNYKFSTDSSGYLNMKILVNDSAGSDMINMKIYVVGESQVVHLTLWQTEDNLRKVQDEITKELSQTGYQFIPDNILPAYREDGTVDNSKSVLVTHAIDADGNIVTGKKLISILDESPVTTGVQNNFKISKTESGEDVGKMVNDNTEERMRYILIAIIAVIAATFVITLGLLLHNIRKFKRKLKAATIEVHGLDQMKRDSFPGLDNHDIKSANPLFMMQNLGFDGNNDYDADNADTLSQNSQNSLDQNAVVSRDPGTKAKPAIDEQEVTLDMYGSDDVGPHSSGLYPDLDFGSPEPLQDNVSLTDEKTWRFNDTSDEKDIQQTLDLNNFEFTEI